MPDEIRQKIELNAQQALDELGRLDQAFVGFGNQLTTTVNRLNYFNDNAGKTVAALKQITKEAESTFSHFSKFSNISIPSFDNLLNSRVYRGELPTTGLLKGGDAAKQFNDWFDSIQKTGSAAQATEQAINNLGQTGKKSGESVTLSWQTFARVLQTQALVRGLNMVRDAFTESYDAALEFSKQVGEIRAIDPDRSFGQIAANIRQLSDAFNQPLSRVAEAQYQTISDQFVTAADRANILSAANLLAKTSNQDLAESAQLLTGALNAYGESSDMAGLRAAQFFKTVELGRLRMGELGTALGRIQSIGHELGVSMEELDAALVATTIGGVKANEAATQLRGVMTALLKPSDGMKEAFRHIGVDSGEAAIATWGLKGTLEQLQKTTDGSATAMATMFQNVRGLAGALRLAESGAQKYDEAIKKLHEVDQSTLRKLFEEFTSTDAEKLTVELNKIKNFFTAEFGADLVKSVRQVMGVFGGADGMVPVLRAFTNQLGPMAAGLGTMGLALAGMAAHARLAKLEIGGLNSALLFLIGLPAAKALGEILGERIYGAIKAPQEALRQEAAQELEVRKQQTEAAIRENDRKNNELIKGLRQYLTEANKLYLRDAENFKSALKIEERVVQMAFDRIMQLRQKMTQEWFSAAEEASNKAAEIPREIAEIQRNIADRELTKWISKLGIDLERQFAIYKHQAEQFSSEAAKLQGTAKSSDQDKIADTIWKHAEGYAKQTQEIAKQIGDAQLLRQAEWVLLDLDNKRIGALKEQIKTQEQVAKEAENRAHQAEAHNLELEGMREAIEGKLKATTKDAEGTVQFKGKEQFKRDLSDAEKLIASFVQKLRQYSEEDFTKNFLGDPKAFQSLRREAEMMLAGMNLEKVEAAPRTIAGMFDQFQKHLDLVKLQAPVLVKIEKVTGLDILSNGLQKVIDAYEKKLNEATARAIKQPLLSAGLMAVTDEYQAAHKTFDQFSGTLTNFDVHQLGQEKATDILKERTKLWSLVVEYDQLSKSLEITDQNLCKLNTDQQAVDLGKTFFGPTDRARIAEALNTMREALLQRKTILEQQKGNVIPKDENLDELNAIKQQVEEINRKKDAEGTTKAIIDDQFSAINKVIDSVNTLAASWGAVANAAGNATLAITGDGYGLESQFASVGGLIQRLAKGGSVHFFDGGGFAPHGTDSIPAMLSPGEFVINAASSRRFASQLIAMNAGIKPAFRSEGGSVTNIGDINVTVSGGGSSRQTARSIATELRRELRRGTAIL
jgi:TP901 family phage tail tape measure protein